MAKTFTEKKICDACGAKVRHGSVFCYNCGGAVAAEEQLPAANYQSQNAAETRQSIDPAENSDFKTSNIELKTTKLKEEIIDTIQIPPIEKPAADDLLKKIEDKPAESPKEDAKLKSAANMRRKAKNFQRKTVEVVWEEPESAPNKWFPIVAMILILLVVGIFYLAMYLK